MAKVLSFLLLWLFTAPGFSQAVTQGRTSGGLPWAVVELPGGDGEWVAVWLPPDLPVPAGWDEGGSAGGRVVTAWFSALSAPSVLGSALAAFPNAVAVTLVGPVPARELAAVFAGLEGVVPTAAPQVFCSFADGLVSVVRKSSEGFRWSFPLPPPWDPRSELARALAFLVEKRFQRLGFSGPVRIEGGVCPVLVLEHTGPHPRRMLAKARESRRRLAAAVEDGELTAFAAIQRREAALWAVDPKRVAVAAVERLGWGQALGPLFFPVEPAPAALEAVLQEVLLPKAGQAEVWERERRALPPEVRTLSSGVVLAYSEMASDVGILAVAFFGVDAALAQALAQEAALLAAKRGLPSQVTSALGMAAASLAGSPEELMEALEDLVVLVGGSPRESPSPPALAEARSALGLAPRVFAENLGVVLALPEGRDDLAEAAEKFLSALPAGKVRRVPQLAPGLAWTDGEGPVQVVAVVELPANLAGAVVTEVLAQRLRAQGADVEIQPSPGKLALLFWGGGKATVQEQDEALGAVWETARLFSLKDTTKAWESLSRRLQGSAAQKTARQALSLFFPAFATSLWVQPEDTEVREVLGALPSYKILPRFGVGPGGVPARGEGKRR